MTEEQASFFCFATATANFGWPCIWDLNCLSSNNQFFVSWSLNWVLPRLQFLRTTKVGCDS